MTEYDQKYGFGSAAKDLLKKVGVKDGDVVLSFGPSVHRNPTAAKKDPFNDLLKDFLGK